MLTFALNEEEQIRERGLSASTFVAQPFWLEMQRYLYEQVQSKLQALADAEHASNEIRLRMLEQWRTTKELVARIERFPQLAIEAARETGEQ